MNSDSTHPHDRPADRRARHRRVLVRHAPRRAGCQRWRGRRRRPARSPRAAPSTSTSRPTTRSASSSSSRAGSRPSCRPGHHRQLGQVGRLEQGQRGAARGRDRRRLDGRLGRAARPLERLADPGHRHLLAARMGGHRGARRARRSRPVADLKGKKIAATKGTDPYFFLLQALEEAGLAPDRRDRRGPPARRRLGGAPERLGRRVGRTRPDHGRRRGGRRDAALPQRRLQQLRLPQRHRVVPHEQAGRRPGRRRRLRAGPRLGAGATPTRPPRS